jgi:LysM repeat protein
MGRSIRFHLIGILRKGSLHHFPRFYGLSPGVQRSMRWGVVFAIVVGLIAGAVAVLVQPTSTSASLTNILYNGGFEQGFTHQPGCGAVGSGWQCFTNGGAVNYGFYDDQWDRVVAEGSHSQLIELNTYGVMLGDADRYAGIYQTVPVVAWAEYTLSLKGLIRTTNMEGDPWRYRVQVGWTFGPYPDWTRVTNWMDVGWDKYYLRTEPGAFSSFTTRLRAEASHVTVYIRVWKKWGVPEEELDVNLDAIALVGPSPHIPQPPPIPSTYGPAYGGGTVADPTISLQPSSGAVSPPYSLPSGVCMGPNLVYNGDFEGGFNAVSVGHVGASWGYFTNGGGAEYGFYDDQWPRAVADGRHSQLIEINTRNRYPVDNDRYAGIYQYIKGLHPGATYEFSMKGVLRGEGNEDDPYRFAAQWGFLPGYNGDWQAVNNWTEMNLGPIAARTDPGPMVHYSMKFVAPASEITLFIRGWKKWGIPNVEMDFNIDSVAVIACGGYGGPTVPPVVQPPIGDCWWGPDCEDLFPPLPECQPSVPDCSMPWPPEPDSSCTYVVQPGDTLASIAHRYGVSLHHLIAVNNLVNPDLIFVGQVLRLPGCDGAITPQPPLTSPPSTGQTYVVRPGDTLSQIAARRGVSVEYLRQFNGLVDPNFIYVGQVLIIP